ncbi:NUDIX domain-containing protein [Flaviaesturariibacter aridisoli]|uniref:NUDIX domain-containing protein n=1 Tax=Flaviaesturariibacter aridisoli TaxID=2545761 RepID=A0A4R4E8B9_9BACT|nr:NUDIX domain-containing protein [Flaviaesturariibacter aridisoli]TCZ73995.1 NUDIX domain-containing protein [Flaviaesturariibacter aridisoli]
MRQSAGILLYRISTGGPQFFLVHPGGPFWAGREEGTWSIPKGEFTEAEQPLAAARREFFEETGFRANGPFHPLGTVKQKAGKVVHAWAAEGDIDPAAIHSNTFRTQWPPRSGKWISVPEIDKAGWFDYEPARVLVNPAQAAFLDVLLDHLRNPPQP